MSERVASLIAGFGRLLAGATVRTTQFVPDTAQRVYFANHTSHLDFVVLWSALPREVRRVTRPVAGSDYWNKGAVRRYLAREVFRAILIEREAASRTSNPIDDILTQMGEQFSIIIFPEGTRGSGESVGPFKSGIYHLASRRPSLDLVPVYIENLNRILPKGEVAPVPLLSSIHIGAPLRLEQEETKQQFLDRARAAVVQLGSRSES